MNKHDAIFATNSSVVTIRGDVAYDANENVVQYNETAVQAYMNANAYKDKRANAYPSIADQLDLMYHGGYDAWKAAIQSVKEEFPK
jgi:rhodanese-related sulfurtransferase